MVSELEFIENYLKPLSANSEGSLSLADDAAILATDPTKDTILSKDLLISGQHFFTNDAPADIAYKALAVNLSDIAAKGATPQSFMLGIAFPKAPEKEWASQFVSGLDQAMTQYKCTLLGGDTTGTKGPLALSITIFGQVAKGKMVKRSGAIVGDKIYVSGTLGDAALGYKIRNDAELVEKWQLDAGSLDHLLGRYLRPEPRVNLASSLTAFASSAMDISDGLTSDLAKLCAASNCGAEIDLQKIPFSPAVKKVLTQRKEVQEFCLGWGDDYEILATVPENRVKDFEKSANDAAIPVTCIGEIKTQKSGVSLRGPDGAINIRKKPFFSHF